MSKLAALMVVAGVGVASAEPIARVGLTMGLADQSAPGIYQLGPQASLGLRLGAITGEVDYAYLSFFDPYASPNGVHRVGLTLRAELLRDNGHARNILGAHALFVQAGGAERFGQWQLDAVHYTANTVHPELHGGVGIELDNRLWPHRYGWQVVLDVAVTPADAVPSVACRGAGCPAMSGGGLSRSVLLDWMFLFGQ